VGGIQSVCSNGNVSGDSDSTTPDTIVATATAQYY
jgi:hypothetical protein